MTRYGEKSQAFLFRLGELLRPLADPVEIERAAARSLGEYLGANQVHYGETVGDVVVIEQGYGNALPPMVGRFRHRDFGERLFATYSAGKTAVSRDVTNDPAISQAEAAVIVGSGFRAYVGVPLVKNGAWVATLAVHNIEPRDWTQEEIGLVEETAERTWAAVERARVETALRESELRYWTLFNSIDEGFCTIDVLFDERGKAVDYRFVETNPAFIRQTGLENAVGKRMRELAPDHEEFWFETYGHIAKTGEARRFEHAAAAIGFYYDVYAFRMGTPGGNRVAIIFNDITERKRVETNLRASLAEREALLKELHHRVKNNLQVITSLLEMQARRTVDAAAFASLAEAGNRVSAIAAIHEMLYQSGSLSRVDLGNYARRLVPQVVAYYQKDARVRVSIAAGEVALDLARAVPFGLLLNELVSNACKHAFASDAEGELAVTLRTDDGHIFLRVADTGPGLPKDFDERAAQTLGIQLVRMLAEQLGGTVSFTSGAGTSVDVRFPVDTKAS